MNHSTGDIMSRRHRCFGALLLGLCFAAGCASPPDTGQKTFSTPEEAAEAIVAAAERFNVPAMKEILGPDGLPLITSADAVQDSLNSIAFAAEARVRMRLAPDSTNARQMVLRVGADEWPVPIPLVKSRGKWRFDAAQGKEEILNRRIGRNELYAIEVCRGYVEAQEEYASELRGNNTLHQYAQHVISTPGKQDGLAWLNPDSTWGGPVGEGIARLISEGYSHEFKPFHGYYFKILTGQGPAATLGELDFKVKDAMIGGYALVAGPAEYGVTGIQTFIVSHDNVVFQKDFGANSLEAFQAMTRYNPDPTWTPVEETE